jgi:Fe-S cluster assembly protein SufD
MNTTIDKSSSDQRAFERAYTARPVTETGAWLQPVRENAIRSFSQAGFPTIADEDWKYTNLTDVATRGAEYLLKGPGEKNLQRLQDILDGLPLDQSAYTVVFANGVFERGLSSFPEMEAGLTIENLNGLGDESTNVVRSRLGQLAQIDQFQLAALNTAFMTDGLVLRVQEGASISRPIHAIFLSDEQRIGVQPRVLIELGPNSSASVIEHHTGRGPTFANAVTEIHCADGARLGYTKIQQDDPDAYHLASQHVRLDRDSHFDAVHIDLGARLARNDLTVKFAGPGAFAQLHGLFVADRDSHIDNHTRLDHLEGQTTSVENYRGIILDRGRGVFNGKIIVHAGADKTDAQLNNRNLLLSDRAEINTKPELEIYTDDVKCSHGTTTGQLDTDALFYLRARGFSEDQARQMLVSAFANEIIDQVGAGSTLLSDHVRSLLQQRLPG